MRGLLKQLMKKKKVAVLYQNNKYLVKLASTDEEKNSVYRLRYQVFSTELGESKVNEEEKEYDDYDQYNDHLMLIEKKENKLIGTYRILPWHKKTGKGYYCEQEFSLQKMPQERIAEIGRLCIDKKYRKKHLLLVLWLGVYNYLRRKKIRYLFGCLSLKKNTSVDDVAKIHAYLEEHHLISKKYTANPLNPLKNANNNGHVTKKEFKAIVPPLLLKYIKIRCFILGPPSYDPEFKVYDFLTMFDLDSLQMRSITTLVRMQSYLDKLFLKV